MNILRRCFARLANRLIARVTCRLPDFVVGGHDNPYLLRWWLIPRNPVFNIYVHKFLRDDDDRALHDHPWFWCSIVLRGKYVEHTIRAGGVHRSVIRAAGSVRMASPWRAHRVALLAAWWMSDDFDDACAAWFDHPDMRAPCWTLFITGPRLRNWGFHCPERGWVPWQKFTAAEDSGAIGLGCGSD